MGRTGFVLCDGSPSLSRVLQAVVLERMPERHLFLRLRTVCPCLYVCFACPSSVDAHGSLPPRAVVNHTAGTFWYKDPLVFNSLAKYPEVEKQDCVAVLC